MVKVLKNISILAFLMLMIMTCFKTITYKAESDLTSQVGFYAKANIPDNQRDKTKTYFDLRMKPNDSQTITVEVGNVSEKEISVYVEIHGGRTNQAGDVDYQEDENADLDNPFRIENIAEIVENKLSLLPGESKLVEINLKMPEKEYDGEIIGGITIRKENDNTDESTPVLVENAYNYVIGLALTENDKEVLPKLELINVLPNLVNYRTAVVHTIVNKESKLMKNATMNIKVYDLKNDYLLWENEIENLTMAPNSTMDYTFYLENELIVPGTYFSVVEIVWEGYRWEMEKEFVVKEKEADMINSNSLTFKDDEVQIPFLAIVLVIVLIIFLIAVIYGIVRLMDKDKNENNGEGV